MRPDGGRSDGAVVLACAGCLARAWLLDRLGANLEVARGAIATTLALADEDLIGAVAGRDAERVKAELRAFDAVAARERIARAGLEAICRCDQRYPARLRDLGSAPAVVHVAGGLERLLELVDRDPVALVGARRASPYGVDVARSLARGVAAAGLTVVSGMALGVDSAAHAGALELGGATVAVLPAGADRPYPPSKRDLYRRIRAGAAVVSELPPGSSVWRWTFPARNRIIAALAALTIVVEARGRSGALLTAAIASGLSRPVGAVPGRITSPLAAGPHRLIAAGAHLISAPADALEVLFGAGAGPVLRDQRPPLEPALASLLSAIGQGADPSAAFAVAGFEVEAGLAALAELELGGYVRREPGGRFAAVP